MRVLTLFLRSIMNLFETMNKEAQHHYAKAGVGLITPRAKNAFFPNWHAHQVTALDPFQSKEDFHNHLQCIGIKPLTCYFLSWYRTGEALYELGLAALHLLTLSPKKAFQHTAHAIDAYCASAIYRLFTVLELLTQTISFLMRSIISIGLGIYHSGEYAMSHLPSKKQDEAAPIVSAAFAI